MGQRDERGTLQLLSRLRKHWLEEKTADGTHTALPRTRAVHGPPDEQWVLLHGSQQQHSKLENRGQNQASGLFPVLNLETASEA